MTSLEAVTESILSAIATKDLEELDKGVKQRTRLLASGAQVTAYAWELGQQACLGLASLQQELSLASSRLEQMRLRLDQVLKMGMKVPQRSSARRAYFG
jgi:hypothetical protein